MVNNNELKKTYFLVAIFVIANNYRPMYFGVTSILFYNEKTKNLWKVTFGAGVFCILLNLILIPMYGIKFPAIVLFFSNLIMGYGTFYLKDYKEINFVDFKPVRWFFFTILCLASVLVVLEFSVLYKFIISILFLLSLVVYYIKFFKTQNCL
jgi:O-antigen/teichoic acid export membrane protein